jgi:hypothetical protein
MRSAASSTFTGPARRSRSRCRCQRRGKLDKAMVFGWQRLLWRLDGLGMKPLAGKLLTLHSVSTQVIATQTSVTLSTRPVERWDACRYLLAAAITVFMRVTDVKVQTIEPAEWRRLMTPESGYANGRVVVRAATRPQTAMIIGPPAACNAHSPPSLRHSLSWHRRPLHTVLAPTPLLMSSTGLPTPADRARSRRIETSPGQRITAASNLGDASASTGLQGR